MNWTPINSVEDLIEIDLASKVAPILIFKHSTTCSISAASLGRLERNWDIEKTKGLKTYYLDLLQHRDISNAIEERYGVHHESPQVLIIKSGKAVYDESHFGINFNDIAEHAA